MRSFSSHNPDLKISKLIVAGINYRQADVRIRSLFSLSSPECNALLETAKQNGLKSAFILTTCNRTELYAYCHDRNMLINFLAMHTKGTKDILADKGFVKTGTEALRHLFHVAAGLDSQITGDFEILGQLKAAVVFSRERGMIGPLMDRTVNFALQASKAVRTNTGLSTGAVSVSYAAIEWLKKEVPKEYKRILLVGTGKFGTSIAKNVSQYFPASSVTLINRTDDTARSLAGLLSFDWKPFSALKEEAALADVIIVCTNADAHTLLPGFFRGNKKQWIMDLSVPENVHPAVRDIPGICITDIDQISQAMKATLVKRKSEIPRALSILEQHQQEFLDWMSMQRHVPMINDMKDKLYTLGEVHFCDVHDKQVLSSRVNKAIGSLAMHLRYRSEKGCHYINVINEFLKEGRVHV